MGKVIEVEKNKLKEVSLDIIEEYYFQLCESNPEVVNNLSTDEIAAIIEAKYNIKCSGREIFLLHEPTLEDDMIDISLYYPEQVYV